MSYKEFQKKNKERFSQLMEAQGIKDFTFIPIENNKKFLCAWIDQNDNDFLAFTTLRKKKHDDHSNWIIEKKDYDKLRQFKKFTKVKDVLSINFFSNNYFSMWSIGSMDYPTIREGQFKKNTVMNADTVDKLVVWMKNKDAKATGRISTRNNSLSINYLNE
ncbi:hypothetical protein [Marinilabilia salmonicolor]|uniref:Uncharacterized protein n=1 Tax=Marinilabilia salmonicolor TaxID=989 RepID=A0A368VEI6_9BACT|nr:hypothetical protein [Marinilabilia salmonicolor]RCW38680.1 hypothetical protein DFO77_103150 [Marinilabilia salmonicolor]